jgi:hypothetical protein
MAIFNGAWSFSLLFKYRIRNGSRLGLVGFRLFRNARFNCQETGNECMETRQMLRVRSLLFEKLKQ